MNSSLAAFHALRMRRKISRRNQQISQAASQFALAVALIQTWCSSAPLVPGLKRQGGLLCHLVSASRNASGLLVITYKICMWWLKLLLIEIPPWVNEKVTTRLSSLWLGVKAQEKIPEP
jgi:hypothetical protein